MLSLETPQRYRKMTPAERLRLTFDLMKGLDRNLCRGTPDQVNREFELLRHENDARSQNMLRTLGATKVS